LRNINLIISSPVTLVQLGAVDTPSIILFFIGFLIIAILDRKNIPGAILIGILLVSVLGIIFHVSEFHGVFSLAHPFSSHNFDGFDNFDGFNNEPFMYCLCIRFDVLILKKSDTSQSQECIEIFNNL
jgi:xanthine/uracil/vitamin C permease (AzgA family)